MKYKHSNIYTFHTISVTLTCLHKNTGTWAVLYVVFMLMCVDEA